MTVLALDGAVRRYAWGSRTAIPELLGVEPDGGPVAELWFGTHPDDPSAVVGQGLTLDEVIAQDPVGALGRAGLERFGERLPFLVKILAAEKALSIQVHPTREEARRGYAAEDAAGVPRDAAERNYRDPNHKPELLCALTPFEALCGFRPVTESLSLVEQLDVPELAFVAERLRGPDPLRSAFTAILEHPDPGSLVAALVATTGGLGRHSAAARVVELVAPDYPTDAGVVLALLLNYVRLAPGEAIYLPAGNVHAYLRGTGVEIMAASDNVLRCGLTAKHVDVPELLAITDFTELADPLWPRRDGIFTVPVPDFRLVPLTVGDGGAGGPGSTAGSEDVGFERVSLGAAEAWVVVCTAGEVEIDGVTVRRGHAAFVPAYDESVPVLGDGTVFAAAAGL